MSDSFDQQGAQRPTLSLRGSRQDGHSGQRKVKYKPQSGPHTLVNASGMRLQFVRPCRNELVHAATVVA